MIRILVAYLCFIGANLLSSTAMLGNNHARNPFTIREFKVVTVDIASRRARVIMSLTALTHGTFKFDLTLSPNINEHRAMLLAGVMSSILTVDSGAELRKTWDVALPPDDYQQLARVNVTYESDPIQMKLFNRDNAIGLYADISKGRIVSYSQRPDRAHTTMKAPSILVTSSMRPGRRSQSVASTTIDINISGRITTEALQEGVFQGVPGVTVFFDWDDDLDDYTPNYPTYSGANVSPYAVTDDDGNFSFVRQVIADNNSPIWNIQRIAIGVEAANDAGYEESLGSEAIFPEHHYVPISISTSSPTVTASSINHSVDQVLGNSLRYLWRARQFAIANFWITPGAVQFNYDPDDSEGSHYNPVSNTIDFVTIAQSETGYHEYGHFYHYRYAGFANVPISSGSHQIGQTSNDKAAFTEGWAEFFCGAAHTYWYQIENPGQRENEYHGTTLIQFLDADFDVTHNTGDEESAVARFWFNLWDHREVRATASVPDYEGDNDDLDNDRPFGHPRPWLLYTLVDAFHASHYPNFYERWFGDLDYPLMDAYRDKYLGFVNTWYPYTYPYHEESIWAMFRALRDESDSLRAATPTDLTVTGNWDSRTLTWVNHGCPNNFTWTTMDGLGGTVDLRQNPEIKFVIWRKEIKVVPRHPSWFELMGDPCIVDGRLDGGFQQIGLANAGVNQFVDNDNLMAGRFVYVVVACRQVSGSTPSFLSIPKARAQIVINSTGIKRLGSDGCNPMIIQSGGRDSLLAEKEGSVSPTYHWITMNKPAFITLQGQNSSKVVIVNNYQAGVDYHPGDTVRPFSIRCVIIDSSGADTSLPYYPAFAPLDSANQFVSVWNGSYFVPEYGLERPLDFITQPGEDFISVVPIGRDVAGDTASGWRVMLRGLKVGTINYTEARLLTISHPPETVVGGSVKCGFKIYTEGSSGPVEDTTHTYGLEPIPLDTAYHKRLGIVTNYIAHHDNLWVTMNGADTMVLVFNASSRAADTSGFEDSLYVRDTTRDNWVHDFILELRGTFNFGGGSSGSIPGLSGAIATPENQGFMLEQNVPNPFAAQTTISYSLGADGPTSLILYDSRGSVVRRLVEGFAQRGSYELPLDLSGLPIGSYFYRLVSGNWSDTRVLTVVR